MKILKKILKYFLVLLSIAFLFLFVGFGEEAKNIEWGVNFSQKHSEALGLDWKKNYLAILDDLGVKKIKLATHWDLLEKNQEEFNFEDLDWQINEAEKKNASIILVIGMKTPRWPECHIPQWAMGLNKNELQSKISQMLREIVLRYKQSPAIWAWQVENEIFLPFGNCPWRDKKFLKKEIELVKSIDSSHPIIISDSGEYSLWWQAAMFGDIVGITTYKKVWFKEIKSYLPYPFPPVFYLRRLNLVKRLFNKEVICVELQAEPWGPVLLYDLPLEIQEKNMDIEQFKKNIAFAKKTGVSKFYLWGAEWWYWMKEKQRKGEIWEEARKLF